MNDSEIQTPENESPVVERAVKTVITEQSGTSGELFRFALPMMVAFVSFTIMGVVDTVIMGKVGTAQQGGVGLGMNLTFGLMSLFTGTMGAVNTFVAQAYGAGKYNTLKRPVIVAMTLIWPISFFVWLIVPFIPELVDLMQTNSASRPHVISYMSVWFFGAPFMMLTFVLSGFLRGLGDMKTPMLVTVLANGFNICLDIIFVFGYGPIPAMGTKGAALATVMAMFLAAAMYLREYLSAQHNADFGTRQWVWVGLDEIRHFLKVGLPIGGAWFVEMLAWSLMTIYIASIDPAGLAAHTIVWQCLHFAFMPTVAVSIAAMTLVGQYLGAESIPLAKRSARLSIFWGVAFMALVGFVFAFCGRFLVGLFTVDPAVIELGRKLLFIAAFFQIFDALGITTSGVLRGAGDTRYPLIVQLVSAWVVFIPLTFILGKWLGYGVIGAWIAALVFIILLGCLMIIRFIGGRWTAIRVV